MISSPFPHHTIASLRQVGMMGLTPLRFELNRVKLFGTELDTHTHIYIYMYNIYIYIYIAGEHSHDTRSDANKLLLRLKTLSYSSKQYQGQER